MRDSTELIKITFTTKEEKTGKKGKIIARIFDERAFVKFDSVEQTNYVYNSLIQHKRKAIKSRGQIIQLFNGMLREQIKDLLKKDIENGIAVANEKTKKKIIIEDYKEEIV